MNVVQKLAQKGVRNWKARRGLLTPGLGVKRWLLLLAVAAIVTGAGIASLLLVLGQRRVLPPELYGLLTLQFLPVALRVLLPLIIGGTLMLLAIVRLSYNLVAPFRRPGEGVVESLYSYRQRNRGPKIVAIGGGTGLPNLLRGLTKFTSNITAIITVADDGGSSGRLRQELGVLPPGDFRNNIAALAQNEALMAQLLQYRFGTRIADQSNGRGKGDLQGHAFGNLLIVALAGITGSFDEALIAAGKVLAIRGRVIPSTLANVTLVGKVLVADGEPPNRIIGESAIPKAGGQIEEVSLDPPDIAAYPPAVQAILQADLVIIGPGSLYTSIIPNLLVPDIARALRRTKAMVMYICNLATQPGETDNYAVADHVAALSRHMARDEAEDQRWIDLVLANDNLSAPTTAGGGSTIFVLPLGSHGVPMVTVDLVDDERPWRHDSQKLARAVMRYLI